MSDVAIRVDNLGKRYRIGALQQSGSGYRYKALRDVLAGAASSVSRRVLAPFRGGHSLSSEETEIWALKGLSFEIKAGDVVGIIGRNGAGKSTLLKVLSRVTEPTEGYARIHGRIGSLLEVGTGFHPELTGRENIYLNGAILGMKKTEIERKFDEIVAFAEVEKFIDTPVKHFSSGMYLRLAFAVAAHLEPEILLVDEVLAVGDAAFQKKCLGKMGDVAKQGRTVLFVSHNMAAVRQLCGNGLLLNEGRVLQQGPIDRVLERYFGIAASDRSCIKLKPADHVTGLNGIRVRQVRLVNGVGDMFAVGWKQPIHIVLDIEVARAFGQVSFGLGITTVDGTAVFTVHDIDLDQAPVALAPGSYRVEAKVDNPLRLGVYNLILGAHEAIAKTSIFYIPNAIHLEVVASSDSQDAYFEHNSGIVNGVSTWSVSPAMGAPVSVSQHVE